MEGDAEEIEKELQDEYEKHIVSTDTHETYLHRTPREYIDDMMTGGFRIKGPNTISSTATLQPVDLEKARGIYKAGGDYGDSVAVIKLPREILNRIREEDSENNDMEHWHDDIGYTDPKTKDRRIKPEYVVGWIDRKTNKFTSREDHLKGKGRRSGEEEE